MREVRRQAIGRLEDENRGLRVLLEQSQNQTAALLNKHGQGMGRSPSRLSQDMLKYEIKDFRETDVTMLKHSTDMI